jgi:NAD(P)-dependent dehydrogenase (short-subunit alcohol dehydrogenase family)
MMEFFKVNAVANAHLFNLFMPLILKGRAKKVVAISSGSADLDSVRQFDIVNFPAYAMSKAALNVLVAKFSAQYRRDAVLFISICPGLVEAGHFEDGMYPAPYSPVIRDQQPTDLHPTCAATPEQLISMRQLLEQYKRYAPHFSGPARPEDAVRDVISVWERASVENGDGGDFVSHLGNKQWL